MKLVPKKTAGSSILTLIYHAICFLIRAPDKVNSVLNFGFLSPTVFFDKTCGMGYHKPRVRGE